jgi:hypothetical protein
LIEPPPPEGDRVVSLCTWKPGHVLPRLAIEVVSLNHPHKDYLDIQEKYAACGIEELWVLDPLLHGPRRFGGPWRLQVWRREVADVFARVYAGDGPYHCGAVDVWVRVHDDRIALAADCAGLVPWRTSEEAARAAEEAERAEKEAERAARIELERRLRALQDEAAKRR